MPDFNNTLVIPLVQVVPAQHLPDLWNFQHSLVNASLPLLASSIFFACAIIHASVALISRRLYMLPFTAGCMLEISGQIFRIFCLIDKSPSAALNFYILYSIVTDLVPCLFLTSIGWMLQHMMKVSSRVNFPSAARGIAKRIIILEILSFSLRLYALIVQANPSLSNYWRLANWVITAACLIELVNLLWIWLSLLLILRKQKLKTTVITPSQESPNVWILVSIAALSVAFVMIHTISGLVFHLKSRELEPFRNELLTFLLQGLPLALTAICLLIFHPCRYDGGLADEALSFFSPERPLDFSEGEKMSESRTINIHQPLEPAPHIEDFSHTDGDSGPFWTVPLSPQLGNLKRSSHHVRLIENRKSHSTSYNLKEQDFPASYRNVHHRRSVSNTEKGNGGGLVINKSQDLLALDTPMKAGTRGNSDSSETGDLSLLRQRHSTIYFEKNPLGIPDFQNDSTSSPRNPLDGYSISSYYDGASKIFGKEWADEIFKRNRAAKHAPWDEESVYSQDDNKTPRNVNLNSKN